MKYLDMKWYLFFEIRGLGHGIRTIQLCGGYVNTTTRVEICAIALYLTFSLKPLENNISLNYI